MKPWALAVVLIAMGAACGASTPPKRGVIESDVSQWSFRRYQAVLDIEVWVPKNKAKAHTASYVKRAAEKRGRLEDGDVVNVFVTRYRKRAGIQRALVKFARRLAQESGYVVDQKKYGGARLFLIDGHGEKWAMWASRKHVVKVGGRAVDKIPKSLVEAYSDRYPSKVKKGALDGELPEGFDEEDLEPEVEEYDPDNPRPDWDKKKKGKKRKKKKKKRKKDDD